MINQDSPENLGSFATESIKESSSLRTGLFTVALVLLCACLAIATFFTSRVLFARGLEAGETAAYAQPASASAPVVIPAVAPPPPPASPAPPPAAAPVMEVKEVLTVEPNFVAPSVAERLNILVVGIDARPEDTSHPRTDTIMLLSWDQAAGRLNLVSFPRDLWVPVPGYDPIKINLVYSIGEENPVVTGGGEKLLMDTISQFVNQPVHHYVRVNFNGFIQIVDLLGGLNLYVPFDIRDEKYPTPDYGMELFELAAGYHHLDGATALKYARTRTQDGDYARNARQQAVINAILHRVTDPAQASYLLQAAPDLMRAVRGNFDTDLNLMEILDVANQGLANPPAIGMSLVLDRRLGEESISEIGMWVLIPDRQKIRQAMNEFFAVNVRPLEATGHAFLP